MKRIALFPGSFDPITVGHENIIKKSLPLFDEIIVSIGVNGTKQYFFALEKRIEWIKEIFKNEPKVRVESYTGLTIDFCKKMGAQYILRGLRTATDFEYENLIAQNNKVLNPEVETVCIFPDVEVLSVSSTVVRDVVRNGGDASKFVSKEVTLER